MVAWRLRSAVDGSPWPDWMLGEPAEVDGVVRAGPAGDYRAEHAARRLIRLADQVGHLVELHGIASLGNLNHWRFNYRGQMVVVRNLENLPGWSEDRAWQPVVIRGTLTRVSIEPSEDDDGWRIDNASWMPLSSLRASEVQPMDRTGPNGSVGP
jgi:hypothetical protein